MESALLYGGKPTALQLYLPRFGMRVAVHLLDRQGGIRQPLEDESVDPDTPSTGCLRLETGDPYTTSAQQ